MLYVKHKLCFAFFEMIVSYRDRKTERFANGEHVKEFSGVARQAETRLDRLEFCDNPRRPRWSSWQPTGGS